MFHSSKVPELLVLLCVRSRHKGYLEPSALPDDIRHSVHSVIQNVLEAVA